MIRRTLSLVVVSCAVAAAPAAAQSAGGAVYTPATRFSVAPRNAVAGTPLRFTFRAAARMRARVDFLAAGRVVTRAALGVVRRGTRSVRWIPPTGALPAGTYTARLVLTPAGHTYAAVTAPAKAAVAVAAPPPAPVASTGVFPVQGPYTFGDTFGVDRPGHVHQGQDIAAASGTPIVAPLAGTVLTTAYQASAAGYYVVLHGADTRDYVFMHVLAGSTAVVKDEAVTAGQLLGLVGATGDATGPHLHFEIWPDGWYASKTSRPIDPLPQLKLWAGLA